MIDRATTYRQFEYDLQPSDCVVLVTDGITEAMNAAGDIYGFERLRDNLTSDDPCRTGQKIIEDVQQFITQRPAKDDMCVVCCARNPA
jgi:serine phosphatase RsbU (regulator of sigma subunit)